MRAAARGGRASRWRPRTAHAPSAAAFRLTRGARATPPPARRRMWHVPDCRQLRRRLRSLPPVA
eukprot:4961075-Prymnesium_polylepis.1